MLSEDVTCTWLMNECTIWEKETEDTPGEQWAQQKGICLDKFVQSNRHDGVSSVAI